MWTTYSVCCGRPGLAAAFSIGLFSLSASVVSHVLEDYYFCYF
jgi:hypothetical protein